MKCPNCGSERIQYSTHTKGGGFSFFDSCCGFLIFGPLGLLCGSCGSGVTTDEFWICQDCGKKFDTKEAKKAQDAYNQLQTQKENERLQYLENKKLESESIAQYGSIDEIDIRYRQEKRIFEEKKRCYDIARETYIESCDEQSKKKIQTVDNVSDKIANIILIPAIATIVLLFIFMPLAIVTGIASIILFITMVILSLKKDKYQLELEEKFLQNDPEAKILKSQMDAAEKSFSYWNELKQKIDACRRYEEQNPPT